MLGQYCVSAACNVPQRLKPEGLISFTAGLKTCSTPPVEAAAFKKNKNLKTTEPTAEGAYHPGCATQAWSPLKQSVDLLIRHCAFSQRVKCSCGSGFLGDAAEQAHGCPVRAGAIAHAFDAEFGEFGNRRDTGAGENIHRGLLMHGTQMVDDGLDMVRVAEARNKDAVGTGLKISLGTLQGITHGFSGFDSGLPVSVRAGVDDEMNSCGLGSASGGLDTRDLLPQLKQRIAVADGIGSRAGILVGR